jgi:hypothetical protein
MFLSLTVNETCGQNHERVDDKEFALGAEIRGARNPDLRSDITQPRMSLRSTMGVATFRL